MWNQKPSFMFEIDDFSKKEDVIRSKIFVCSGCQWFLSVYPKGDRLADNHLSFYLYVANVKSLRTGWTRSADFYFLVLNQSDKELYRSSVAPVRKFCAGDSAWGHRNTFHVSKLQEKGVLENDKLIIEVYINVVEAVDGEGEEDVSKNKETVEINGFQVLASQATLVSKLFAEHPDIAKDVKPKNQMVKTAYMNVLLNLTYTSQKPDLSKVRSELSELMEVGFKLDWLKTKLGDVPLESKKKNVVDEFRVQGLVEGMKNLDLMKAKAADGSRVQKLEESIKNLVLMESRLKTELLKAKLEGASLEKKKAEALESFVLKTEERIKKLEVMELGRKMECLKSKFEEESLERKKSDDANGSQVQQYEERIKNLEMMVSNLKVEMDKKNTESCDDGFLLVHEVA